MDWKLEVVPLPVADIDIAKQFYAEQLGFVVDLDDSVGEAMRFVQLTPPGSACSVVLGAGISTPPGSVQGLQLVVTNIDAARDQLIERGVEVSAVQHYEGSNLVDGRGGPWNAFVFFADPDGNTWVLQERPS
jgi:catechol 2,3-dioxygenase-like lactoylglutathione lyase family enzyme